MARATANHNRTIDLFDRRCSIKLQPFLGQGNLLVDQRSAKKLSRIRSRYPMWRSSRHSDEARLRQNYTDIDRPDYAEFLRHCITCVAHGFNTCATVARVSLGLKSLRKRFPDYFDNSFRSLSLMRLRPPMDDASARLGPTFSLTTISPGPQVSLDSERGRHLSYPT